MQPGGDDDRTIIMFCHCSRVVGQPLGGGEPKPGNRSVAASRHAGGAAKRFLSDGDIQALPATNVVGIDALHRDRAPALLLQVPATPQLHRHQKPLQSDKNALLGAVLTASYTGRSPFTVTRVPERVCGQ